MKFTQYFLSTRRRPDREWIKFGRIQYVIGHPIREELQSDGRIRCWARIVEARNKYLRVILLEDGETAHNVFFDSSFKDEVNGHQVFF